ncbi:hypothetical protein RhiirA5_428429 [Rhizophagus irregularis]|uniref:Uncharacterized protein n=1 Tax=Rhizophagus irregularis TaxID=588596 RepID=A0A2N0S2T6_9GLOM|nr:hypothetical protein RhiirA5_428429 [Rhizophagus irregularis]PKC69861.1 hypothetical protein RhiirA1_455473 [Rhizophagus irregularis]GET65686.1 hypothetical protein RIR_e63065_A0A2N0S2T6_9GLOM [Rhizophagus irregularis DAOM 181602=DAOM 197198]
MNKKKRKAGDAFDPDYEYVYALRASIIRAGLDWVSNFIDGRCYREFNRVAQECKENFGGYC